MGRDLGDAVSVLDLVCGHRGAPDLLAHARAVIDPGLRAAVDALPSSTRHVAGYHLGWWDEHGQPRTADGGKGVRPALTLAAAAAVGADAVPAAVAIELAHNYTRLHDDIVDGDRARRGRPAAWAVFGRGAAMLAGDALLALAYDVIAPDAAAVRLLTAAVTACQDGQAADLSFERRTDVTLAEGLRTAERKTGALITAAVVLGAPGLRRFGERLGLAYQLVDDVLGIWGDPDVTGKPVYADLDRRKKTLPVLAALASGTPAGRELAALYHAPRALSAADVVRAAELVERAGGRAHCLRQADDLLAAALEDLRRADLPPRGYAELAGLAHHLVHRDR
ncbi:(2E,6E)-farnesyl diphosphate synthase [Actinokineospora sp. UTMC 2448]|nr:(2E,6E)-farnesyl diphosphate synthase [Actinokineospora sp. UTMC 2448]